MKKLRIFRRYDKISAWSQNRKILKNTKRIKHNRKEWYKWPLEKEIFYLTKDTKSEIKCKATGIRNHIANKIFKYNMWRFSLNK